MTWRSLTELAEQDDWRELESVLRGDWDPEQRNNLGDTSLHIAAERGYKDCVETLLGWNADMNARDAEGATPLHRAVRRNQAIVVEMLVKAGADITAETRGGRKALDEADSGSMIHLYLTHKMKQREQALEAQKAAAAAEQTAVRENFTQGLSQPLEIKRPLRIKPGF